MGNKSVGKGIVGFAGVIIAIAAIGFAFSVMTTDLNLKVELTGEGIHIQHKGAILLKATDRVIDFSDITDFQLFDQLPKIHKVNGLDNSKLRVGAYSSEEFGSFTAYVNNLSGKAILFETTSERFLITPANFDEFVTALQQATGK